MNEELEPDVDDEIHNEYDGCGESDDAFDEGT
jgi:hypothetical protein